MKFYKRYKAVAYFTNVYSLLQYLLLEPYGIKDTLFFIHGKFPKSIASRLPESDFLKENSPIVSLIKIYGLILFNRNLPVFLCGERTFTDSFLRFSKNVAYLEDGTASYELQNMARSIRKRKSFLARLLKGDIYPKAGLAGQVHKIYLTGILPIPEVIADKVELINLNRLWLEKTKAQKEEICRIFLPEGFDANRIGKYDVLLLTQPFSEYSFGHFSEEEKIDVYRKLTSGYDESKLIIKIHPAETTDYSKYFPKACVLNMNCPLELLVFMGLRAKTVITINSTAIFGLDEFKEKIISGYDVTPALKKEAIRRGIYKGISNKSTHIIN